jgi:hypothetical protein
MIKTTATTFANCTLFSAQLVQADNVEIYLTDMLDNTQSGYCIDIACAQGEKTNPAYGLQGHTC